MDILKLLAENPTSGTILAVSVICLVFYCGGTWDSIRQMKREMVTKADLAGAIHELHLKLVVDYVTKDECETHRINMIKNLADYRR